jgi:NAD(P)-dependent dehydrogenase (short-subunit alcohol dehydrogenase family)
MFDLTGKVVLVAGGAGFLGLPVSIALAKQGATVVIASRNADRVTAAVKDAEKQARGGQVHGLSLDVGDENSIRQTIQEIISRWGRLDVLVNATYHAIGKLVGDITAAEFDLSNHVHITGSFLLAREAANVMKPGSSIIQYISMYGIVSPDPKMYGAPMRPNPVEYGVAKAGLAQMVRYLAAAYGPRGIRVNAIAPGAFDDETDRSIPGFIERMSAKTMLGRPGERHETAGAVVFLASDDASYVTGSTLTVDGGWTAW